MQPLDPSSYGTICGPHAQPTSSGHRGLGWKTRDFRSVQIIGGSGSRSGAMSRRRCRFFLDGPLVVSDRQGGRIICVYSRRGGNERSTASEASRCLVPDPALALHAAGKGTSAPVMSQCRPNSKTQVAELFDAIRFDRSPRPARRVATHDATWRHCRSDTGTSYLHCDLPGIAAWHRDERS